jgi:hypothetical protein
MVNVFLERVQDQQGTRSTGRIRVVYVVMSSLDLNSSHAGAGALGHCHELVKSKAGRTQLQDYVSVSHRLELESQVYKGPCPQDLV